MRKEILRMEHIYKTINHANILEDVTLNVLEGEILAMIGANGAGKKTLVEVLAGITAKDQGHILFGEERVTIQSPQDAKDLGIRYVHRNGRYLKNLTVAENIFLGKETGFLINKRKQQVRARELLQMVGLDLRPNKTYTNLGVARERLIELASVLDTNPRLIIIDEPMTALKEHEELLLKDILKRFTISGTSIIYITHSIREALNIADRIVILQDGMSMGIYEKSICSETFLLGMMSGEAMPIYAQRKTLDREEVLRAEMICSDMLKNINLTLYEGEILGLIGMVGAGKTQLLDAIFGVRRKLSGNMYLRGKKVDINNPEDAISLKIGYVSEDWNSNGLFEFLSVRENITIPSVKRAAMHGIIRRRAEQKLVEYSMEHLFKEKIDVERPAGEFSTGVKQKLRLCKWLSTAPDILLLDEPALGVDVNSRKEIYNMAKHLSKRGMSIIIASEEIEEMLQISDRIVVLSEGQVKGELSIYEATRSRMLSMLL